MRGQQIDGLDLLQRTLGIRVKQTQAVDFIIKKVEAIRLFAAHRKEIQQRAARRVFAMLHHLIDMPITGAVKLRAQSVAGQPLAFFHHQRMTMQIAMRTNALHQGVYRYNQDAALHRRQLVERGQTRRDNFLMRGEAVIR